MNQWCISNGVLGMDAVGGTQRSRRDMGQVLVESVCLSAADHMPIETDRSFACCKLQPK